MIITKCYSLMPSTRFQNYFREYINVLPIQFILSNGDSKT